MPLSHEMDRPIFQLPEPARGPNATYAKRKRTVAADMISIKQYC